MEEFWLNFHFLRPWLLLLLAVPVFLYAKYFRGAKALSSWQKVIDKRLLDFLLVKGSAVRRRFFVWAALAGVAAAVVAAAGPSWNKIEIPSYTPQNPVMILLNLSSDMDKGDLTPSRLSRAKYKIQDFLGMLKGVQAGMEVYSAEPFVISPLTDDMNILKNLLPAIAPDIMPVNGDRLDRAIELAVAKIKDAGYTRGRLVIFTPDVGQKFDLALAAAKAAKAEGFAVDVVGVSASVVEKLRMVASAGGGEYWPIQTDDSRIAALAEELNRSSEELSQSENMRTVWLDAGYWLVFVPLFCCMLFFRRGILAVVLVLAATDASAGFFRNADQEGLAVFNEGKYDRAAAVFVDSDWKAAALYRAGDYAGAYEEYKKNNTADGLYNQGNALAKSGKIEEAIAKYEEVLKQDPHHQDAEFNLEYLKNQQQRKKQPQNQNNGQNQNDNRQQQQKQQQDDRQNAQNQEHENRPSDGGQDSEQRQNQEQASPQSEGRQDKNSDREDDRAEQEKPKASDNLADENQQRSEGKQTSGALPKEGGKEEKYDEKMQAKARRYREIPEDPGGLLKAFIYQEYRQNRYNEQ